MDWTALTKELMTALLSTGLGFTSCLSSGCTIHLHGEGEIAAGMRNTNEVFLRHSADGDKQGSLSECGTTLNPKTWDWINDKTEESDPGDPDVVGPSDPDTDGG